MQITHLAGIDLASNGWQIVADPMLAGTAGDNWQQTEIGLLSAYPRPITFTLLTSSTNRNTIITRVRTLLSTLDAVQDYERASALKQWILLTSAGSQYAIPFRVARMTTNPLQSTGGAYLQTCAVEGIALSPPFRTSAHTYTINDLLSYNIYTVTFPTSTIWSPSIVASTPATFGPFGGIWIGELSRGGPASPITMINPSYTSPSATINAYGSAARASLSAGTYNVNFVSALPNDITDVWLHIASGSTCTVTVPSLTPTPRTFVTSPDQVAYYLGRYPASFLLSPITITCSVPTDVWSLLCTIPHRTRALTMPYPVDYVEEIHWSHTYVSATPTYARGGGYYRACIGAIECTTPQQFQFVMTYYRFFTKPDVTITHYPIEPGIL